MAEAKMDPTKVILLDVRASFLNVFEPKKNKRDDGTLVESWGASFLIDKDKIKDKTAKAKYMGKIIPVMEALKKASAAAKAKKWGENEDKWPKLKPEKVFVRDGDLEEYDGYANCTYVSANAMLQDKPAVVTNRKDANGNWIDAEPGGRAAPYSGCYVNATIVAWAQDNDNGKRVNSQVKAVQFLKDGDAFGAAPSNPNDDFDDDMVGEEGDLGDEDNGAGDGDDGDDDDAMI